MNVTGNQRGESEGSGRRPARLGGALRPHFLHTHPGGGGRRLSRVMAPGVVGACLVAIASALVGCGSSGASATTASTATHRDLPQGTTLKEASVERVVLSTSDDVTAHWDRVGHSVLPQEFDP
jgi:hypothetical protein